MPHLSHKRAVMLGKKGGRATARMHAKHRHAGYAGEKARWGITGRKRVGPHHQTGRTHTSVDRRYKALHPGKRVSINGVMYYEYRKNRTDVNRTRRI